MLTHTHIHAGCRESSACACKRVEFEFQLEHSAVSMQIYGIIVKNFQVAMVIGDVDGWQHRKWQSSLEIDSNNMIWVPRFDI